MPQRHEAHAHWESVWLVAQEPGKTSLQGLIQVAASFHHFQSGNLAGTVSLLRSALRRLEVYPEAFAGVAGDPLRATIRLWLDALETPTRSPCRPFRSSKSPAQGHFPHSGSGLENSTPIDSCGLHLDREPQVASDEFLEDEFGLASLGSRTSGAYKQRTISVDLQWTRAETGLGKRP